MKYLTNWNPVYFTFSTNHLYFAKRILNENLPDVPLSGIYTIQTFKPLFTLENTDADWTNWRHYDYMYDAIKKVPEPDDNENSDLEIGSHYSIDYTMVDHTFRYGYAPTHAKEKRELFARLRQSLTLKKMEDAAHLYVKRDMGNT